jgi:hypothetical protein
VWLVRDICYVDRGVGKRIVECKTLLEVGCGDSSYNFYLYFWKVKSAFCGEV